MAKKSKKTKKREARFETSLSQTLKNNWVEISTETVQDGLLGAGAGIGLELAFGMGSMGLNAGIGAGAGVVLGFARGTAVCHQREGRLNEMGNEVLSEVSAALNSIQSDASVADAIRDAVRLGEDYLRAQGVKLPDEDEEDEEDEDEPKQSRKSKSKKQRQAEAE